LRHEKTPVLGISFQESAIRKKQPAASFQRPAKTKIRSQQSGISEEQSARTRILSLLEFGISDFPEFFRI
jgi:hypothetical protein